MVCDYYEILIDDVVIASRVTLEWTLPIVKAVFEHLYNETDLAVTVRKMEEGQRRGRWIEADSCMEICSECNGLGCGTRYCPNCGAEMEGRDG